MQSYGRSLSPWSGNCVAGALRVAKDHCGKSLQSLRSAVS
jgi:hypothetical protein